MRQLRSDTSLKRDTFWQFSFYYRSELQVGDSNFNTFYTFHTKLTWYVSKRYHIWKHLLQYSLKCVASDWGVFWWSHQITLMTSVVPKNVTTLGCVNTNDVVLDYTSWTTSPVMNLRSLGGSEWSSNTLAWATQPGVISPWLVTKWPTTSLILLFNRPDNVLMAPRHSCPFTPRGFRVWGSDWPAKTRQPTLTGSQQDFRTWGGRKAKHRSGEQVGAQHRSRGQAGTNTPSPF